MKSIFWPILLFVTLWIIMIAVLPVWVDGRYVPNLILAGTLVLAVTYFDGRTLLVVSLFGLFLDIHSSLLMGSYALALPFLCWITHFSFTHFIPSDRIYIALPLTYVVTELILKLWVYVVGLFAAVVGWPIAPLFSLRGGVYTLLSLLVGGVLSVGIYLLWLEITHRFDKPLRLRR
jgi:hypothetical protein